MTIEQYNKITELAEQGKTGIEIVAAINAEAQAKEEPEAKTPEPTPTPDPKPEPTKEEQLLTKIAELDTRIAKMQETFHAVNIMNSKQPETPTKGSKDILAEVFAGYTEADKGE